MGNRNVLSNSSICKVISVKPLHRNNRMYEAVVQVDIESYNKIMEKDKVFVEYDCCSVYDSIHVCRCYKCSSFHHIAKHCIKSIPVCLRFSEFHFLKDCTATQLKYVHCSNLKSKQGVNNTA